MKILALIPARSGSKGLPDKNIRSYRGKPLIAHSIEQALQSKSVTRVIVSTDSESYAEISRQHGAEVPFLRPMDLAGDHSTDFDVFRHALEWLQLHEAYEPDICVHLRPTYPNRSVVDIEAVINILLNDPTLDSVRSMVEAPETPFKMWFRDEIGDLAPVCEAQGIPEAHSMPRQALPMAYLQNAAIDAIRPQAILSHNSMVGKRIHGYIMQENHDIDDIAQFEAAEKAHRYGGIDSDQT